eukprot:14773930-Alexandrium_andersonii.AAC.1
MNWATCVKKEAACDVLLRQAPRYSHQSQGAVESANAKVEAQIRAVKLAFDERYGVQTTAYSHWFPWLARQESWLLSVYQPRKDGRSSFAVLYGHEYTHDILEFGECVIWRDPAGRPRNSKLEPRFGLGVWVGGANRSGEHV